MIRILFFALMISTPLFIFVYKGMDNVVYSVIKENE